MAANERTNERGNRITSDHIGGDRYRFDFHLCTADEGWRQYDTRLDFHGFGVWVHLEKGQIVTFAEGDLTVVDCPTTDGLKAELAAMAEFYGPPPPAFIVFGQDGSVTHVYDERPEVKP